ncbi:MULTISPECIES: Zn-dependent oxidoreductase [Paraburkholderia]|uniref:Zn-dependent oxidoreductase n=1 Tax=Paraburkholderia TaxID=1822464 RepID=UPI0022594404|nr:MULTISPECIES: Zn-dependent oxidoreductase [Paraburkholderia]MCX4162756.1 Zn-dependent oxidoreductase [Paraburkholderia megapolitana]MDN7158251.1 Zn-dependent oxidoreductase [Paraburkholderia sp. CHISQ3]MDQ6495298.1 Zn-dependent oxidoreductase [Paraburkholderia megapolitana]
MKAICVTPSRGLEVRDVPTPDQPAPGHVVIDMDASAINHGDKTFLRVPTAAGSVPVSGRHDVWGASGSGRIVALGAGVPEEYAGKQVAIYRALARSPENVGLWCEKAHMRHTSCLILPDHVRARDYCGSLVNVMTAYAFLEEIVEAGHKGVIVTAGNSATGHALAALARKRNVPAIFLVRTEAARDALRASGVEHVIVTREGFTDTLAALSTELGTTAVFDGVGGDLLGKIAPSLPMNSTIYFYGFLGGSAPASIQSALFMMKNLIMRRFSNYDSRTVKDQDKLVAALKTLAGVIDDPMFMTRIGKEFSYDQIDQAMAYESLDGSKAVLVA